MKTKTKNTYLIIGIIILLILILCQTNKSKNTINQDNFGNYCLDCKNRPFGRCVNCFNCGFISKNGKGQCIDGDQYGPTKEASKKIDPDTFHNSRYIYNDPFLTNFYVSNERMFPATYSNLDLTSIASPVLINNMNN